MGTSIRCPPWHESECIQVYAPTRYINLYRHTHTHTHTLSLIAIPSFSHSQLIFSEVALINYNKLTSFSEFWRVQEHKSNLNVCVKGEKRWWQVITAPFSMAKWQTWTLVRVDTIFNLTRMKNGCEGKT